MAKLSPSKQMKESKEYRSNAFTFMEERSSESKKNKNDCLPIKPRPIEKV